MNFQNNLTDTIANFFINNNIEFNLTIWWIAIVFIGVLILLFFCKIFGLGYQSYSTKSADKYHKKVDYNGYYVYPYNGHIVANASIDEKEE